MQLHIILQDVKNDSTVVEEHGTDDQKMTVQSSKPNILELGSPPYQWGGRRDDLSVVFHTCAVRWFLRWHLLCTFSAAGHFHICARERIYETVTDSSPLPPTWSTTFSTWKEKPQKRSKIKKNFKFDQVVTDSFPLGWSQKLGKGTWKGNPKRKRALSQRI